MKANGSEFLLLKPTRSAPHADALALELGMPLAPRAEVETGKTAVVFMERGMASGGWLRSLGDVVLCVPPDFPLADLTALSFEAFGNAIRRLVVHTPMHHLFALERLEFPAHRVELIPPGVDIRAFACTTEKRDPGMLVVAEFEGCDPGFAVRSGLNREATVVKVGAAPQPERAAAFARAGAVLVAAANRESGAGASLLLEAMASGAPVAVSRTWGMEHLLVDETEGLFFPVDGTKGGRDAVRRLLSDPTEAARLGANAAAKVSSTLTMAHYAARIRRIALVPGDAASPEFFLIAAHGRAEAASKG